MFEKIATISRLFSDLTVNVDLVLTEKKESSVEDIPKTTVEMGMG